LLSGGAAIGLVASEPFGAVLGLFGSPKADPASSSDEAMPEPIYNSPYNSNGDRPFSNEYNTNSLWVSSLDLQNRQRLLRGVEDYVDDPYYPYSKERPVLMTNSEPILLYSPSGLLTGSLMSPTSDVGSVVKAGKQFGLAVLTLSIYNPLLGATVFVAGLGAYLGHYGVFDYQRKGLPPFTTKFYPQYIRVSNFNIGVFAQQAGVPEKVILAIAGAYARVLSNNATADQLYGLTQNREMIHLGYSLSALGAFTVP
jgi:hypothetical protein